MPFLAVIAGVVVFSLALAFGLAAWCFTRQRTKRRLAEEKARVREEDARRRLQDDRREAEERQRKEAEERWRGVGGSEAEEGPGERRRREAEERWREWERVRAEKAARAKEERREWERSREEEIARANEENRRAQEDHQRRQEETKRVLEEERRRAEEQERRWEEERRRKELARCQDMATQETQQAAEKPTSREDILRALADWEALFTRRAPLNIKTASNYLTELIGTCQEVGCEELLPPILALLSKLSEAESRNGSYIGQGFDCEPFPSRERCEQCFGTGGTYSTYGLMRRCGKCGGSGFQEMPPLTEQATPPQLELDAGKDKQAPGLKREEAEEQHGHKEAGRKETEIKEAEEGTGTVLPASDLANGSHSARVALLSEAVEYVCKLPAIRALHQTREALSNCLRDVRETGYGETTQRVFALIDRIDALLHADDLYSRQKAAVWTPEAQKDLDALLRLETESERRKKTAEEDQAAKELLADYSGDTWCYRCLGPIHRNRDRICAYCGWNNCQRCGACGCAYQGRWRG